MCVPHFCHLRYSNPARVNPANVVLFERLLLYPAVWSRVLLMSTRTKTTTKRLTTSRTKRTLETGMIGMTTCFNRQNLDLPRENYPLHPPCESYDEYPFPSVPEQLLRLLRRRQALPGMNSLLHAFPAQCFLHNVLVRFRVGRRLRVTFILRFSWPLFHSSQSCFSLPVSLACAYSYM